MDLEVLLDMVEIKCQQKRGLNDLLDENLISCNETGQKRIKRLKNFVCVVR